MGWTRCETKQGQMDPQDVNMEGSNIKVKPGETTEEVDRRHNRRYREELGLFNTGSGGLEDQRQRRGLQAAMDG